MADKPSEKAPRKPRKKTSKPQPKRKVTKKASAKRVKKSVKKAVKTSAEIQTLQAILNNSHQHDAIGHAVNIMQESLGSYIILGYSFNGDPITAVAAQTAQEYDALYARAVQFVQSRSAPTPPPAGGLEDPDADE